MVDKLFVRWIGLGLLAAAVCVFRLIPSTYADEPATSATTTAGKTAEPKEGDVDSKKAAEDEDADGDEASKKKKKKTTKKTVATKKSTANVSKGGTGGKGLGSGTGGFGKSGGLGGSSGSNAAGGSLAPLGAGFSNLPTTLPQAAGGGTTTQSSATGGGTGGTAGGKTTTAGSNNSTTTTSGGNGFGSTTGTTNGAAPAAQGFAQIVQGIIDLTNQERKRQNLPALAVDATLTTMAEQHSTNMARLNTMAHELEGVTFQQRLEQSGYRAAAAGENVAYGQKSAAEVVTAWMNSPGHRANILNTQFTQIGVGVARSTAGALYFTQEFGRPR